MTTPQARPLVLDFRFTAVGFALVVLVAFLLPVGDHAAPLLPRIRGAQGAPAPAAGMPLALAADTRTTTPAVRPAAPAPVPAGPAVHAAAHADRVAAAAAPGRLPAGTLRRSPGDRRTADDGQPSGGTTVDRPSTNVTSDRAPALPAVA